MKCEKCGFDDGWILKEEVCIGQDDLEVEVECNHTGCGNRKNVFIDILEVNSNE